MKFEEVRFEEIEDMLSVKAGMAASENDFEIGFCVKGCADLGQCANGCGTGGNCMNGCGEYGYCVRGCGGSVES